MELTKRLNSYGTISTVLAHKIKLLERLGNIKNTRILDYGCGRGDFIKLLLEMKEKPKSIYAVDSQIDMLAHIQQDFAKAIKEERVTFKHCKDPHELSGLQFDKIICQNVLECVDDKIAFINEFDDILANKGTLIISHHDFDSAIYNCTYKENMRALIHHFADTQQAWQTYCDGQMGRKIPGLISSSVFKNNASIETWRIVETEFKPGSYGFLMANMIADVAKIAYDTNVIGAFLNDLKEKNKSQDYYFAIDLVVAVLTKD